MSECFIKNGHLLIEAQTAEEFLSEVKRVWVSRKPDQDFLLIAPETPDSPFPKLHPGAASFLLKKRNLKGDVSLALHPLCLDKELPANTEILNVVYLPILKALKLHF